MSILILYASAGNGHRRAGQALYESFINAGRSDVALLDILDFTPSWFRAIYRDGYQWVVNRAKWLWRLAFDLSNHPKGFFIDSWHSFLNALVTTRLEEYLTATRPELIVSTHFMANDVLSRYKAKEWGRYRLTCVVTDYVVHRFWVSNGVDKYFVGCQGALEELVGMGVEKEKISVSGIPVPSAFLRTLPRESVLARLGLKDEFTILILANAIRPSMVVDAVKILMREVQIIVGCGRNVKLRKELEPLQDIAEGLKVYGMIDEMELVMSAADLLITKPGGLVVSEAIVKQVPMILVDPIPGQEEGNRDFLVSSNVALSATDSVDLARKVLELKRDPDQLTQLRKGFQSLPSGDVAGRIVQELLRDV